jgi:hypothetical protein
MGALGPIVGAFLAFRVRQNHTIRRVTVAKMATAEPTLMPVIAPVESVAGLDGDVDVGKGSEVDGVDDGVADGLGIEDSGELEGPGEFESPPELKGDVAEGLWLTRSAELEGVACWVSLMKK